MRFAIEHKTPDSLEPNYLECLNSIKVVVTNGTGKVLEWVHAEVMTCNAYIPITGWFTVDTIIGTWFDLVGCIKPFAATLHLETDAGYKAYLTPISEGVGIKGKYEWLIQTDKYLCYFDTLSEANLFHGNLEDCTHYSTRISYDTSTTTDTPVNFIVMLKPLGVALETTADNLEATLARLTQLQEAYDKLIEND